MWWQLALSWCLLLDYAIQQCWGNWSAHVIWFSSILGSLLFHFLWLNWHSINWGNTWSEHCQQIRAEGRIGSKEIRCGEELIDRFLKYFLQAINFNYPEMEGTPITQPNNRVNLLEIQIIWLHIDLVHFRQCGASWTISCIHTYRIWWLGHPLSKLYPFRILNLIWITSVATDIDNMFEIPVLEIH